MTSSGTFAFDFDNGPTWLNSKDGLYSTEIKFFDPVKKLGEESVPGVEFELSSDKWALVGGPSCGILVEGTFQFSEAPNHAIWANCRADLIPHVMVCPNWFGNLIKEESIFDGNSSIPLHSEAPYVAPMVDTYLMAYMHPDDKKFYGPEPCNPCHAVPTKLEGGWLQEADSEWREAAKVLFTGRKIKFVYKPFHNFLFFQGTNEFIDGQVNNAIPFPYYHANRKSLIYRLTFNSHDRIFKRADTKPTNQYRFHFDRISVIMTVAKLSTNFDRQISSFKRKTYPYRGVTRIMMAENIPEGTTSHKCRFQQIYMPEQVLVFAIHKNIINGTWTFEANGYANGQVFSNHDIKDVQLMWNNQPFYYGTPNFGQLQDPNIRLKMYLDFLVNPPFGMIQNDKLVKLADVVNLGEGTPYPLVYVPLTNADKSRIRTVKPEVCPLNQRHDLDITVQFKVGAQADVSYCFYALYTDYNVKFENGRFESYYVAS